MDSHDSSNPGPAPDQPPMPTEFLVREAVHGEKAAAWDDLSARIVAYLRSRFGNHSFPPGIEFTDFVSDTMLKVLTSIEGFEYRGKESFWKWVQTLAGNLWRDLWRRYDRDRRLGLSARGEPAGDDGDRPLSAAETAPSDEPSPTGMVRFRELEQAERDCIARLSETMREVYVLRRQHELSFAEISAKLGGIKEVTLRSHYMRARDGVRECLGRKVDQLGTRIQGWR
ncbi:MAG: sigma-70 family RNA polymerase sigma factor [Planctomycetes bacterium]|nr:sigma-70 family RNA polymerase sigma factor [Planctomycetota bacterium]